MQTGVFACVCGEGIRVLLKGIRGDAGRNTKAPTLGLRGLGFAALGCINLADLSGRLGLTGAPRASVWQVEPWADSEPTESLRRASAEAHARGVRRGEAGTRARSLPAAELPQQGPCGPPLP